MYITRDMLKLLCFPGKDLVDIMVIGDAKYGSLNETNPADKYYYLKVEYLCKKSGTDGFS